MIRNRYTHISYKQIYFLFRDKRPPHLDRRKSRRMDWQKDERTTQIQPYIRRTQTDRWTDAFMFQNFLMENNLWYRGMDKRTDEWISSTPWHTPFRSWCDIDLMKRNDWPCPIPVANRRHLAYSKPVLSGLSKIDILTKMLMTNGGLMKVENLQNAPIEAFWNTFDLH